MKRPCFPSDRIEKTFFSALERVIIRAVSIVFFILISIVFFSCGSKKKNLEITREKVKTVSELDSTATSKLQIETSAKLEEKANHFERELEIEYEGCEGDSLTVTETGADGKIISQTTIKGKGKAKVNSKEKKTDTVKSEENTEKKDAELGVSVKKKDEKTSEAKKKGLEVEKSGLNFWFWFWLILIIIVISILIYLNKRFNIIKRVTDFV